MTEKDPTETGVEKGIGITNIEIQEIEITAREKDQKIKEPSKPIDSHTLYDIIIKGKKNHPSGLYERTTEQRLRRRLSIG